MPQTQQEMLLEAIERNSAAVLSLPSAGMFRYHKTRFLRAKEDRVWMEGVESETALIKSLIEDKTPAVVAFKVGAQKVTFTSPILEIDNNYRFFDATIPVRRF